MTKATQVPPSQLRYHQAHPVVSFRLSKPEYERLQAISTSSGRPVSRWVSEFVRGRMATEEQLAVTLKERATLKSKLEYEKSVVTELEQAVQFALDYADGLEKGAFEVPCNICGKPMIFQAKDSEWQTEVYPKLIDAFGKWRHTTCVKPR